MNDDMKNEDLLEKRKEKVEDFKLSIAEEEPDSAAIPQSVKSDYIDPKTDINQSEATASYYEHDDDSINSYSDGSQRYIVPESEPSHTETRKIRKAERRRKKRKAKKNGCLFRMIWLVMIVLVSVVMAQYIMVGVNDMLAINREEETTVTITIPKDATLDDITDILYENDVISNKFFFKLYATMTKSTSGFTQGSFEIETNRDYASIINYLQSTVNRTDVVTIQFTEGMTILEYAELLEENDVCTSEDFLEICNSDEFDEEYEFLQDLTDVSSRYYKLEGYLFPDTYDFYVGEDPSSVVLKFLSNYTQKIYYTKSRVDGFDETVTIEEQAEAAGMTLDEVIILASLIQAEAADEDDMYIISSILHNRLDTIENDGVSIFGDSGLNYLQLDSTLYYPYKSLSKIPSSIADTFESRYNTYNYEGLPYGAICNPSLAAIQAALAPADTDYYYFCHKAATEDSEAECYYAETLSEHISNLAFVESD